MSSSKLLRRIAIKTPCAASWEVMTGNDQVRFCEHCSLHVQDLSQMTRVQAVQLVLRSKGRLCLRVRRTPEGEIITDAAHGKLHAISRRTSRLAAGAFTAVMGLTAAAYGQSSTTGKANDDAPAAQQSLKQIQTAGAFSLLSGTVVDTNGAVIPGATIVLTNEQSNEKQTTTSDDNGEFQFWVNDDGTYSVEVSAPGFIDATVEKIDKKTAENAHVSISLIPGGESVTVGIVIVDYKQPLVKAASDGDLAEINKLLRQGENVNQTEEDGTTALDVAVGHGDSKIVRRLLRAGANPALINESGNSILFWLNDDSSPELVRRLLRAGANVNQVNLDGNTPLINAAGWDSEDLIRALIDAGASLNAQNKEGNSALMVAAQNGNVESVKALLGAGAIYGLRNTNDQDALGLAAANEKEDVCEILRAAGAVDSVMPPPAEKQILVDPDPSRNILSPVPSENRKD